MISFPNAKINLGLNVVRKREDGFHDIESVFFPVPCYDVLEILPIASHTGTVQFSASGIEVPTDGASNLCIQAYNLMHKKHGIPSVKMHLHKTVPIGAGLGGGSADAAFTLRALNTMFDLGNTDAELEQMGATIGSDCPFFICNQPALVTGRGEHVVPCQVNLSGYWIVLVNWGIHIETQDAYRHIQPEEPKHSVADVVQKDVSEWKELLKNDFENTIFKQYPSVAEIKDEMYAEGAVYAAMTGSGSTVYGLFKTLPDTIRNIRGKIIIEQL